MMKQRKMQIWPEQEKLIDKNDDIFKKIQKRKKIMSWLIKQWTACKAKGKGMSKSQDNYREVMIKIKPEWGD